MKALLDSSAWIELLVSGPNSATFAGPARAAAGVVVPVICLHETFRFVSANFGDQVAEDFNRSLMGKEVLPLSAELALEAARLGRKHGLALADSVVYASALHSGAELWTQDADFKGLAHVHYHPKKKA